MILVHGGELKVTKNKLPKSVLITAIMIGKLLDFWLPMMQDQLEEAFKFFLKIAEIVMVLCIDNMIFFLTKVTNN